MNQEKDINISKFRGTLSVNPELRGILKKYASLSVRCNRDYVNENGNIPFDYVNLKLWKDPEKVVNELKKGQKVYVEARTQSGSYVNEKGQKIYTSDMVISKIDYSLKNEILEEKLEDEKEIDL